jgi:hypothetical protein
MSVDHPTDPESVDTETACRSFITGAGRVVVVEVVVVDVELISVVVVVEEVEVVVTFSRVVVVTGIVVVTG